MSNTITLRPEDIQAIVGGLAANNDALATMAQMMSNPTPPWETPLDQPPSSLSGQGSSSGKFFLWFRAGHHQNKRPAISHMTPPAQAGVKQV